MELTEEMLRLSKLLDAGLAALRESSKSYAEADHAYHQLFAEAFLKADGAGVQREQDLIPARSGRTLSNGEPMMVPDCGTRAGYQRHKYYFEEPCEPCMAAHREYQNEWRRARERRLRNR